MTREAKAPRSSRRVSPRAATPHTHNGHSVGRWDAETLVIDTTHLTAGQTTRNGVPKSEDMMIRATYDVAGSGEDMIITNGNSRARLETGLFAWDGARTP